MIDINPGFKETPLTPDGRLKSQSFRRYRMAWENYPKWDIVDWMPIHLDLETTARCQLKCPGCPSMKLDFSKGDMSFDVLSRAIKEFSDLGGRSVKFNWRGEPTLYRKLDEAVLLACNHGLDDIMINTNGLALTPGLSSRLVENGITAILFSIDSTHKERYADLRPGSDLTKVLCNLNSLCKVAEDCDSVYIRVQRIEYPDEFETHEDFVDYFRHNFPRVNGVATNHYKEKALIGIDKPSKPCAQLWQRLVMTYDGWVGPCCEFNRFKEHRFGRFPDKSLYEIWNSIEIDGLRKYHKEGRQNEIDACHKCTVTKPMVRH